MANIRFIYSLLNTRCWGIVLQRATPTIDINKNLV